MNRISISLFLAAALVLSTLGFGSTVTPIANAASCSGTWQYRDSDLSDMSCPVADPYKSGAYSAVPTCLPKTNPQGAACSGNGICKINTLTSMSGCVIQTDIYSCNGADGVPVATSCGAPLTVTAALVANPTSILKGEQSLLTWSSTGAIQCVGTNFATGGAVSGSLVVSPSQTMTYKVTCSGVVGSANASATVTVIDGSFQLSCQGHPTQAAIGEDVLWSSTVTGPQGTYIYAWSGTDALTGSGTQVFKRYSAQGAKTARLTVEYIPTPGPMALFDSIKSMLASVAAAGSGIWVKSGPTTDYPCMDDWSTSMYAGDSFNASICGPSATCSPTELGNTCFTIENAPPFCSYGGAGPMSLPQYQQHITPYTCTEVATPPTPPTAQCPAGQTATPVFNVAGGSCSGGTQIGKVTEMLDGAQIGMWPDGWLVDQCSSAGAVEGDCCEYSQRASNNTGGGFPPNSYYQIRVVRGGAPAAAESTYVTGVAMCSGFNLDYSCSSVGGIIGHQCKAGNTTSNPGGTGKVVKTVQCDNAVQISAPQCSDGIDNNGDGLSDEEDPGCLTGGGSGDGGGGSGGGGGDYDPNDNSEGGTGNNNGGAQCSDGIDNNGDGTIDYPEDPGCSSGDDNLELSEPADLSLKVDPPLIKKNQQCTITLSARNVASCSLSGSGISRLFTAVLGVVTTKEVVTPGLAQTATYTLQCRGLDGKTATKKVDCKIAPTFEEI